MWWAGRWRRGALAVGLVVAPMTVVPAARWRLGAGLALFAAPAYPGSRDLRSFVYPYPYFFYQTPLWHWRHDRVHIRPSAGSPWSLGVAVNATPPDPAGIPATRIGMPELAPTLAIGPEIRYRLRWRPWGLFTTIGVHSRYRLAVPSDFHVRTVGVGAGPFIEWQNRRRSHWPMTLDMGPVWRTAGDNRYFFTVPVGDATTNRPAYQAPGGYAGVRLTASVSHRLGHYVITVFARGRYYGGAVFRYSPLLTARMTVLAGVALVWIFATTGPGA
ncbi:MAG: MipA/OmpV family protein [Acidiferrobacter sp.]